VARDFEEVLHRTATGAGDPLALSTAVA
jgi:hypothetical protein